MTKQSDPRDMTTLELEAAGFTARPLTKVIREKCQDIWDATDYVTWNATRNATWCTTRNATRNATEYGLNLSLASLEENL